MATRGPRLAKIQEGAGARMQLQGKVAIITGASRGIGKGIATVMAREGAAVAIAARSETEGRIPGTIYATAEKINAEGGKALAVRCDVSQEEDVRGMVERTLEAFGRIDVLVNNAGGSFTYEKVETYPIRRFDRLLSVNVRGVFLCCQAVLPTMIAQKSGSIITISSAAASAFRYPGDSIYGLSKAAVERFAMGLATEVREHNISVVVVQPGAVKTEGALVVYPPDHDWTGWQEPEEVGPAIVWLARQDAASFTMRVVRSTDFGTVWP
ncbi:MAG: SDR family NAD(P)-dependent oxidoreductase [Dehalococcoidia bacterium]